MGERGSTWKHALDYWLGIPLVWGSALLRCGYAHSVPKAPRKIGFLCLGAIGDLLLLSSLVNALRAAFPRALLCVITSQSNACAAPLLAGVDEHQSFSLRQMPALLTYVRRQRFDIFFDASQWARIGAIISNCSRATCTVGFRTEGQHRHAGYTYTACHRADQHECANFLDLGRAVYPSLVGEPALCLPKAPLAPEHPLFSVAFHAKNALYCHMWPAGIHAACKEWPADLWAELCTALEARHFTLFLTGSTKEAAKNEAFLRSYPHIKARSIAGLPLLDVARLFTRACAVVSVNTGIMHLAALIGAPTIGLHGPTNPRRWGPVGKNVCALLPRTGRAAYLHLGFEYSPPFESGLKNVAVADVLDAVLRCARPKAEVSPPSRVGVYV